MSMVGSAVASYVCWYSKNILTKPLCYGMHVYLLQIKSVNIMYSFRTQTFLVFCHVMLITVYYKLILLLFM